MATSTASTALSSSSRKFNWADDDEDDFDFDTWKASADTSAPTTAELGPLQHADNNGDGKVEYEQTYTLVLPSTTTTSSSSYLPDPKAYLPVLSLRPYHQVVAARYETVTRAIGQHFDGKEQCDIPAYPELSQATGERYGYAREFQDVRLKHCRGRTCVYRNSPLIDVVHIDDTEMMNNGYGVDEELDEWELQQIAEFEAQEDEVEDEMEAERMPEDQETSNLDILKQFSKEDWEDMYRVWKATAFKVEEDDVDSWEKSDDDDDGEEIFESLDGGLLDEDGDHLFCITGPRSVGVGAGDLFSTTRLSAKSGNTAIFTHTYDKDDEDLDFNDVVFGTEDLSSTQETASCYSSHSSKSSITDEGYASSSPPVSLFLHGSTSRKPAFEKESLIPEEQRLSMSSVRRKMQARSDSMDTLRAFRETMQTEEAVEDAFDSDSEDESMVEVATSPAPIPHLGDDVVPTSTVAISPANDDQDTEARDTSPRGILDPNFSFPATVPPSPPLPARHTKALSDGVTPACSASNTPPSSSSPSMLTCVTDTLSTVSVFVSALPWLNITLATAGFIVGALAAASRK